MNVPSVRLKTLESITPPKLRSGSNGGRSDRLPEMHSIYHATTATDSEFGRPDTDHFDAALLLPHSPDRYQPSNMTHTSFEVPWSDMKSPVMRRG